MMIFFLAVLEWFTYLFVCNIDVGIVRCVDYGTGFLWVQWLVIYAPQTTISFSFCLCEFYGLG